MKKTLILGATTKPERYAYRATLALRAQDYPVALVGIHPGTVDGVLIQTDQQLVADVDTVTLYVGPANQPAWYDFVLALRPRRLLFNPGTENAELARLAQANGILTEEACTLVLLATGQY